MKTGIITRHAVRIIVCLVVLGSGVLAGTCEGVKGVNILLFDNSASVPVTDKPMNRVKILDDVLNLLDGYENRLLLFGGRHEIRLDEPNRFINDGRHTDYYYAFRSAIRIRAEYPASCPVKIILLTDGILDAFPSDYPDEHFKTKAEAMTFSREQTLKLLDEHPVPTYIIVLGDRYDKFFIQQIAVHANGFSRANPLFERAAEFLQNKGIFLQQFIFPVSKAEGVQGITRAVRTITHQENSLLPYYLATLLLLVILVLVIVLIQTFPAVGDLEIINLVEGVSILIGAGVRDPDVIANPGHIKRKRGLQHVTAVQYALASLSYQKRDFDFTSRGLQGLTRLEPAARQLLDLNIRQLAARLDEMEKSGTDSEIIIATNLKYYCSNLEVDDVKAIMVAREMDRMDIPALDFLHAKVYLALAPDLLDEMTEHRVRMSIPSRNIIRAQLLPRQEYPLGRYVMRVAAVERDATFRAQVVFEYVRIPSLLGLKRLIPPRLQRWLRLGRHRESQFVSERYQ